MNSESNNFEEIMHRLTEITTALESGDLTLEQALALFKEGTELARVGDSLLTEYGELAESYRSELTALQSVQDGVGNDSI